MSLEARTLVNQPIIMVGKILDFGNLDIRYLYSPPWDVWDVRSLSGLKDNLISPPWLEKFCDFKSLEYG